MLFKTTAVCLFTLLISCENEVGAHIKEYEEPGDTLELVQVLFRHGNRANSASTTYANDPYRNFSYYPYGWEQLTNKGKRLEYELGKALRNRYFKFLKMMYTPEEVYSRSTNMDRTKMSLMLVHAGLYPPTDTLLDWNPQLNWQPIPFGYVPFEQDSVLRISLLKCSKYIQHYESFMNSPAVEKEEMRYAKLFKYLEEHVGQTVNSTLDVFTLYGGLLAQEDFGLKLPAWTRLVYPEAMLNATIDQYSLQSGTARLKQLSGGFTVKEMIKNMHMKMNNTLPKERKIHLYSGHEMNIAYVLNALDVFFPHAPPYGSYIIVELHKKSNVYGVRIFYQDYMGPEPRPLKIPGCTQWCPFKKFVKLLAKNLPADDETCVLTKAEPLRKKFLYRF